MASEPKKDQTSETALRAVEDALNIDFNEIETPDAGKNAPEFDPDFSELEQKLAEAANDLRRESSGPAAPAGMGRRPGRQQRRAAAADMPAPPPLPSEPEELLPANDERQDAVADIVYSLQQPSSSRAFTVALVLSVVWVIACAVLFYFARSSGQLSGTASELASRPAAWGMVALTVIPIMLGFAFASMVRRAHDLRVAARSMTEAAIRLLQPEEMAATSVASVGRAIRREVAAINEGVERALARAGELEHIVEKEVGNLERSYADAEVRLKGLVSELAEERHEIVSHVDRLRDSLTGTHKGITEEVDAVAARIESAVLATSSRIVDALDHEGKVVVDNLETVSGRLTDMLSHSGAQMAETIALRATDFDRIVQERIGDLDTSVERRLTGFGTVVDDRVNNIFDKITQQQKYVEDATGRIETIVNDQITTASRELGTRGVALVKALGTQTQALERVLEERAKKLGSVISDRLSVFGQDVTGHMDMIVGRLNEKNDAMESVTTRIEQAISAHVQQFDVSLRERAMDVAKSFSSGKDVIGSAIDQALESVSAKALEAKLGIEGAQGGLTSAMDERIHTIAVSLASGQQRLIAELDRLDNRSTGLVAEIDQRTENMGELISKAGGNLAALIDQRTEAIQRGIAEGHQRLADELDKMDNRSTGLVAEIDKRTDRMANMVTEAGAKLSDVIDQRTFAVRDQLADGQQLISAELDKLDNRSTGLLAELEKRARGMGEIVHDAGMQITSVLDQRTFAIRDQIREGQQIIAAELDRIDDRSTGLVAEIDRRTSHISTLFGEAGEKLGSVLDQRTDAMRDKLAASQGLIAGEFEKFDARSAAMASDIDRRTGQMGAILAQANEKMASVIDQHTFAIRDQIVEGQQLIANELDKIDGRAGGLIGAIDERTGQIGSLLDQANAKMASAIDERTFAIRDQIAEGQQLLAGEFDKIDNRSSGLVADIERRTAAMSSVLDDANEKMASVIDQRIFAVREHIVEGQQLIAGEFDKIDNRSSGLVADIERRAATMGAALEEANEKMASIIDERIFAVREHIAEGQQLIAGELDKMDNRSTGLVADIDRRTNAMGAMLEEAGEKLSTAIDQRSFAIRDQIIEGQQLLSAEIDKIDHRSTGLVAEMTKRAGQVSALIIDAGDRIASVLDERTFAIRENLHEGHQLIAAELDKMDGRSNGLVSEIDKRSVSMGGMINEAGKRLASLLDQRMFAIRDNLVEGQEMLSAEFDRIDNRATGLVTEIDRRSQRLGDMVSSASGAMLSQLDERADGMRKAITEGQNRLFDEVDRLDERNATLVTELEKQSDRVNNTLRQAGTDLSSTFEAGVSLLRQNIGEGQQAIFSEIEHLGRSGAELVDQIGAKTHSLGEIMSNATVQVGNLIDDKNRNFYAAIRQGRDEFAAEIESFGEAGVHLVDQIKGRTHEIGDTLGRAAQELGAVFDEKNQGFYAAIRQGRSEFAAEVEAFGQSGAQLIEQIGARTHEIGDALGIAATQMGELIDEKNQGIYATIRQGRDDFAAELESFGQSGAQLIEQIAQRTDLLGETLGNAAGHIGGVIDEKNRSIFATMRQGRDEFLAELDKGSRDMVINLDSKRMELSQTLHEHIELTGRQIDGKAEALTSLLSERANLINSTLGNELLETQRNLEQRSRDFSAALAERARELTSIIEERGVPVVEGLRAGGQELVAEIERAGAHLSTEFTTLLENIGISTQALDETVAAATRSISSVERNVIEGTERLSQAVERAGLDSENARQIAERTASSVGETTEYLLTNLSNSSLRFEKQVKQLRESADYVTHAQKQLAQVLETRQEPLQQLATNLTERTSAIEQSIISFSSVLAGLVQDMTQKTGNAGARVTAEIETAFDQAMNRLNDTVEAMRGASDQIRNELEQTRAQMRRGVMELPVEVKESADTMRRVLVDQISALKELSEIVTKSGKAYDSAPPAPQPPRLVAGAGAPAPRAAIHAEPVATPARNAPAPRVARAPAPDMNIATARLAEPATEFRFDAEAREAEPARVTEPVRVAETIRAAEPVRVAERAALAPVPPQEPASAPHSSWVGELLRRASRDDVPPEAAAPAPPRPEARAEGRTEARRPAAAQPAAAAQPRRTPEEAARPAPQAIESLNSLSMDIARAIDHDASVDLWQRYQRGETNVFTRRLYTMQGQKTFDEIRAKYGREAEFRAAVDRYINDFERLLEDVGRNDRDNMMTQTYLTSDTGKVYTMLAHAAGRLGNG